MTDQPPSTPARHPPLRRRSAAWIGSALEYYDFFIYGSGRGAGLPQDLLPDGRPRDGDDRRRWPPSASAYVARPVGAFVLGHFGDTIRPQDGPGLHAVRDGRATFLIGCLPTYDQIGVAAPILLLVLLRVLQGLAAAGEQSSASSMTPGARAAPTAARYYTSFTLNGTQGGNILATVGLPPDRRAAGGACCLGLADPVPAQRGRRGGRLVDPPHAGRDARPSRARRDQRRGAQAAAVDAVPRPLARRARAWSSRRSIATVSTIFTVYALTTPPATPSAWTRRPCCWISIAANVAALAHHPAVGHAVATASAASPSSSSARSARAA